MTEQEAQSALLRVLSDRCVVLSYRETPQYKTYHEMNAATKSLGDAITAGWPGRMMTAVLDWFALYEWTCQRCGYGNVSWRRNAHKMKYCQTCKMPNELR